MVRVVKISKPELDSLVHYAYEGDMDLLEKYHPLKGNLKDLAKETIRMVDGASKAYEISYYKILIASKPIGYFVTWDKFLYSFAINLNYRKKDILISWWGEVRKVLGKSFSSILYDDNTRAISFLEKNGMEVFSRDKNLVTLINYK